MKLPAVAAQNALVKQPQEDWVFTMPFARLLGDESLASIAAVRVWIGTYPTAPHNTPIANPANPDDASDLTLKAQAVDDSDVLLRFSGGVHGRDYYIEIDITTTSGRIRSADGWLLVRDR